MFPSSLPPPLRRGGRIDIPLITEVTLALQQTKNQANIKFSDTIIVLVY